MWALAALSMTIGNLGALLQTDVKRMLAYSSIAHAGYLLVGFTSSPGGGVSYPRDGAAGACFYAAAYAAMNVGAFAVITQAGGRNESLRSVEDYRGLAMRRPVLAALLAFFLLSLIGIPFTAGFFGKFFVFFAALQAGHVWLAVVGLLNSGVACFYYLRLLAALYQKPDPAADPAASDSPAPRIAVPAGIGLTLAAAATLILGILPNFVVHLADYASLSLVATPPKTLCAESPANCQVTPPAAGPTQ
jgi:NADH-quinone oxidoreductase subunit N